MLLQPPPTSLESSFPKMGKVRLPLSEAADLAAASLRSERDLDGGLSISIP